MPDLDQIRPSLSRRIAQQVSDLGGTVAYGGQVEGSSNVAFGGPTADFILYGVVNGAFAQGPPNPNDYIDPQNNPMPYWSGPTQVSGGAIQCQWVADASSPSGYNLRFIINPGAAGDEAYMEQIVPVGGSRSRVTANSVRGFYICLAGSSAGALGYVGLCYLNAAGAATGVTSEDTTIGMTAGATEFVNAWADTLANSPPSDAIALRIRVGVRRDTLAAGSSSTIDLGDVRNDHAVGMLLAGEQRAPASRSAGRIYQFLGVIDIVPDGGSGESLSIDPGAGVMVTTLSTSSITVDAQVVLAGTITATIAADKNDYSPAGLSTCATLITTVTGATRTITGFDATGFVDGQEFTIINDNTNQLTFAHSSASSASGNRIGCPGAANKTISTNGSATFSYQSGNFAVAPFRMVSAL